MTLDKEMLLQAFPMPFNFLQVKQNAGRVRTTRTMTRTMTKGIGGVCWHLVGKLLTSDHQVSFASQRLLKYAWRGLPFRPFLIAFPHICFQYFFEAKI